jgi:hypothetical protein
MRAKGKRSLPARAETAKNLFHQQRTELSSSSWRCGVDPTSHIFPTPSKTTSIMSALIAMQQR